MYRRQEERRITFPVATMPKEHLFQRMNEKKEKIKVFFEFYQAIQGSLSENFSLCVNRSFFFFW